jgi:hypothetical protein
VQFWCEPNVYQILWLALDLRAAPRRRFDRDTGDKKVYGLQHFSSALTFGSNRTQKHTPFCQNDGDRWALFVTGVCSASTVAVSPELRALVAVTAGAWFLRNKRTHFKVR